MATIKTDRIDFEKLLNGLDPIQPQPIIQEQPAAVLPPNTNPAAGIQQQNTASVVDNASAAELMNVRAFEFDYDAIRKGLRKKARKTVLGMVNHIIPDDIIDEDYIQDKIEQDIETMTELYMQIETNKIMQKSLMDDVASGNKMPRMYEVFGQMTDKLQSISKQIVDTEQRIRKTYVDLKYEIRDKENETMGTGSIDPSKMISNDLQQSSQGIIVSSTKNLIANAKKKHMEQILAAKETPFEEK